MNPKLTLTVEGNKIISAGTVSVGEKIDVKIIGLDLISIPDYDIGSQFSGSSLRFRIVDNSGHDLARFPMYESDSWIVDEEQGVYNATDVDLNTDKLRNLFEGVAYGDKLQFGIILDSVVDSAQYARGKTYIQQWPMASIDDPKVLPDWGDVLLDLKADIGEVETFKIAAEDAARETIGYRNDVFAAKSNVESKAAQVSDLEKKCELHEFKSMQYSQEADGAAERAIASENNAKGFSDTASSMAESAANSAKEAKETLANVVKKSGDTMTGRLTVPSITIGEDEPEDLFVLLGGEFDRVVNESALEVEAESKRAKDAEKVISDNLSEEIGNRKDADLALARKIDENTNSMSLKADLVDGKVPVGQLPNALVSPVYSVNGKTGDVVLSPKDIQVSATLGSVYDVLERLSVNKLDISKFYGEWESIKSYIDSQDTSITNSLSSTKSSLESLISTKTTRMTIGTKVNPGMVTLEDNKITRVEITDAEATLDVILPEMKDGYLNYCEMLLIVAEGATSVDLITSANSIVYADSEDALVPEPGINHIVFSQVNAYEWVASRAMLSNIVGGGTVVLEKSSSTTLMNNYELGDDNVVGDLADKTGHSVEDDTSYGTYIENL